MSFRIFGAGTEGFNYSADNCADQDLFQASEVMNAMRAAGPSPAGVGEGVADYVLPSSEGEARSGIQAHLGTFTRAHLGDGVTLLASCNQAAQGGWITVAANRRSFARYNFRPNVNPGLEFMQQIMPALTTAHMNNWGVLLQIDRALRMYHLHIHGRGRPMIQIELYK